MKTRKRMLAIFMVLMLLAGALAGCAAQDETPPAADASASQAGPAETAGTPGDAQPSEPAQTDAPQTRLFTDMTGFEIELPAEIKSVVHLWPASTALQVFLGAGDTISGTLVPVQKGWGWLTTACPHLLEVTGFTGEATAEELLAIEPDVVITPNKDAAEAYRDQGVPCICMLGPQETIESLEEYVVSMGELLGGEAVTKAAEYCDYLDGVVETVSAATSQLTADERVSIYYNSAQHGDSPLLTCGDNYITQTWMNITGVDNIAVDVMDGGDKEVSMEVIIDADPDYIVIGGSNQQAACDTIMSDSAWKGLDAVVADRIIMNPQGVMKWEKFGVEIALQLVWFTKEVYPDLLTDLDVKDTVLDFYSNYYGMDLTDAQYEDLMNGLSAPRS